MSLQHGCDKKNSLQIQVQETQRSHRNNTLRPREAVSWPPFFPLMIDMPPMTCRHIVRETEEIR